MENQAHFENWHKHATQWVKEELEILDAGEEDQEMWLGVRREGLQRRNHIEAALNRMQVESAAQAEEEWLVTKTVAMSEVRSELEEWRGAAKKEYAALVEESKAVKPIRKRDIDQIEGPVEVLPAKAVCTRKSPDGRRKVLGVVCGNYSAGKDAEKQYAGGADDKSVCYCEPQVSGNGALCAPASTRHSSMHHAERMEGQSSWRCRRCSRSWA